MILSVPKNPNYFKVVTISVILCLILYHFPFIQALSHVNDNYVPNIIELLDKIDSRITNELENKEQEFNNWQASLSSEIDTLKSEYYDVKSRYQGKKQIYTTKKEILENDYPVRKTNLDYHRSMVEKQVNIINKVKDILLQFPQTAKLGQECTEKKPCENGTLCLEDICVPGDCRSRLEANSTIPSGVYSMKWNPEIEEPLHVYCDMETDQGGWTLVLNYLHAGGTNPNLNVLTDRFPLVGDAQLGIDESHHDKSWGHISPQLFSELPNQNEVRFYCRTSHLNRQMHFSTSQKSLIKYFANGSGDGCSVGNQYKVLDGHSAHLPSTQNNCYDDENEIAMTNFPFYEKGECHWGIKGNGNRWECDDFPDNEGRYSTYHQIWIR